MDQGLEIRIRQRAYEIWDAHGRPHGEAGAHWLAAERELLRASVDSIAHATPKTAKPKAQRKSPRQAKLARTRGRKMAAVG
jgi:Protein of unknown function (DUF2934)